MTTLTSTLLYCSILVLVDCHELKLLEVSRCSKDVHGPVEFFAQIKKSGFVDVEMSLPFPMNEDDQFHLAIYKFLRGNWILDHEADGSMCPEIDQFIKNAWRKIRKISKPEIVKECHLPKGNYTIEDINLTSNDVYMPPGLKGKFKFDLTLFKNDKEAVCWSISLDIKP